MKRSPPAEIAILFVATDCGKNPHLKRLHRLDISLYQK
jgi:hypothetical protein